MKRLRGTMLEGIHPLEVKNTLDSGAKGFQDAELALGMLKIPCYFIGAKVSAFVLRLETLVVNMGEKGAVDEEN